MHRRFRPGGFQLPVFLEVAGKIYSTRKFTRMMAQFY